MVTGIWVGNDDNSPTKHASGGSLPVEIWSRFMKVAHQNVPPDALPLGLWRQGPAPMDNPIASLLPNFMRQETAAYPAPVPPPARRDADYGNAPVSAAPVTAAPRNEPAYRDAGGREAGGRDVGGKDAAHGGLLPPESIPDPRAPQRPRQAPPAARNFFSDLFGG